MLIRVIRVSIAVLGFMAAMGAGFAAMQSEWIMLLFTALGTVLLVSLTIRLRHTAVHTPLPAALDGAATPFSAISGRWLLAVLVGGLVAGGLLSVGVERLVGSGEWGRAMIGYGLYGFIAVALRVMAARSRIDFRRMMGRLPEPAVLRRTVAMVVPLLLFSYGTVWVIYLPLSYLAPDVVSALLLQEQLLETAGDGTLYFVPNLLGAVALIVLAPMAEEIFFRGFLLHRWSTIWGTEAAVVGSTVMFSILHADPLGAATFGFVMAVVYIQTRSLGMVIICHTLNNLLAYGAGLVLTLTGLAQQQSTIVDFRNEWWIAALCLGASAPWVVWFVRRHWPSDAWPLPYTQNPVAADPAADLAHGEGA